MQFMALHTRLKFYLGPVPKAIGTNRHGLYKPQDFIPIAIGTSASTTPKAIVVATYKNL